MSIFGSFDDRYVMQGQIGWLESEINRSRETNWVFRGQGKSFFFLFIKIV